MRDAALALVYPLGCRLCGVSVESFDFGVVCSVCWSKTRLFDTSKTLCQKCGRWLEQQHSGASAQTVVCHRCDNDFYASARAVGIYEGALRAAILELKEQPFVPLKLQNLLVSAFDQFSFKQTTKIVPVPLHSKRERERGFNQAALLARSLSRKIGLPVLERCLTREVYTKHHRGAIDERARRESVEKAFIVKQPRLIENEKILLVDDVFTSGATASVCAEVLKEKGASEVFVLTVARAA